MIRRQSDDQNIAKQLGLLEMANVADVQQIEDAMTMDDARLLGAVRLDVFRDGFEALDLGFLAHFVLLLSAALRILPGPLVAPCVKQSETPPSTIGRLNNRL